MSQARPAKAQNADAKKEEEQMYRTDIPEIAKELNEK
jgi:hypothetical protein